MLQSVFRAGTIIIILEKNWLIKATFQLSLLDNSNYIFIANVIWTFFPFIKEFTFLCSSYMYI